MNTLFDRRAVRRFAETVDDPDVRRRSHSQFEAELSDLSDLADRLGRVQVSGPDHEFRTGLRALLIATAEREGIGVTATQYEAKPVVSKPDRQRTRIAVTAGLIVGVLAVSSISLASGDSSPGDPLYQVKRTAEQAQLAMAESDVARGQIYLEFARTRLAEARSVRSDGVQFSLAMTDMDIETVEGVRLLTSASLGAGENNALNIVDEFVANQKQQATSLAGLVDGAARQRVDASLMLLATISARTHALRTALACGANTAVAVDQLGPIPVPCATETGKPRVEVSQTPGSKTSPAPAGAPTAGPSGSPVSTPPAASPSPSGGGLIDGLGRWIGDLFGD